MNTRRVSVLLSCFWVTLMASTATAGSMHPHAHVHPAVATDGAPWHPQAPQAVSPFEVKLGGQRLHCDLLGHNPLLPCPHHKVPAGGKEDCYLANDCGGGPFQAPSSRSVGDSPRYLVPVAVAEDDLPMAVCSISRAVFYYPFYFHSLDRPPRAL
ncbi:MAG TPA: hypothetical protein VKA69_05115 [Desulfobacteria bacterium]|nr:hypothetical protein [Desulfobacteria bacterium]